MLKAAGRMAQRKSGGEELEEEGRSVPTAGE